MEGRSRFTGRKRATVAVAWASLEAFAARALSFLFVLVLARLLDPSDFGVVALATVFVTVLKKGVNTGFTFSLVQCPKATDIHLNTTFWAGLIVAFCGAVGVASIALFGSGFVETRGVDQLLPWLSSILVVSSLSIVQRSWLTRNFRFRPLAIKSVLGIVSGGVIALIMAWKGLGLWSLVVQQIVTAVVECFVLWRAVAWRPKFVFSWKVFRELFSFGKFVTASSLVSGIAHRSDLFVIGYFLGLTEVGIYVMAQRLLQLGREVLTQAAQQVAFPTFSRLQEEPERMRWAFHEGVRLTSMLTFPSFIGLACLAPEVTLVLFGEKWAPAIPIVRILAVAGLVQSMVHLNGAIVLAKGRPQWWLLLVIFYAVVNVFALMAGARWGLLGVAVALAIREYALYPLSLMLVLRLCGGRLRRYLDAVWAPLIASLMMATIVITAKAVVGPHLPGWLDLVTYVFLGCTSYFLLLRLISPDLIRSAVTTARTLLPAAETT